MKRVFVCIITTVFIFSLFTSVYAIEPDEIITSDDNATLLNEQEYRLKVAQYNDNNLISMEEIALMSDEERERLCLLPIDQSGISPASSGEKVFTVYSVEVMNIRQKNGYYCGPAATLQALYAGGCYDMVMGNTAEEKQTTLAEEYLYTTSSGTWIDYIPPVMNEFTGRYRQWTRATIDTTHSSKSTMHFYARGNHLYGQATIYLLEASVLDYYQGNGSAHYVTGFSMDTTNDFTIDFNDITVGIADPHYNDAFFGSHYVNFNNLVDAMWEYSSTVGPANYVY